MKRLSVTVTNQQAESIRNRVESGEYCSTSELIHAALSSLNKEEQAHRERHESIRRSRDVG